jgi:hypothetical protein
MAVALAPQAGAQEAASRILFIGNSHTYMNNVPALVQATYASVGLTCYTAMVAKGGYGLMDHWAEREAREEIARGGWTHVVLQQGTSARADSRRNLREYVGRFAPLIEAAGARAAIYSVWPMRSDPQDFERATESCRLAANDVGALLCPAGAAWRIALQGEPRPDLYANDGLHATVYGSYLAALVIFAVLAGRSPVGLPTILTFEDGTRARVPEATAAVLQAAAASAVAT